MPEDKLLENLIKILGYECKAYAKILTVAEKKTDCLVKNDMEALSSVTEEEKKAAEKTGELSYAREQILSGICRALGEDEKTMTLEKLREHIDEPYKTELQKTGAKLSQIVKKLQKINEINRRLIENAVNYIDFNLQLLSSPGPEASIYSRNGKEVSRTGGRRTLDVKY